jgi:hypothetical protein
MAQSIQSLIAASVTGVLRDLYPEQYMSLCHAHAIVGANIISLVFNRTYRPVAGVAMIDCGSEYMRLLDNNAFGKVEGGAYHCWIECADSSFVEREIVDLTYCHAHLYAKKNGYQWTRAQPSQYIWGPEKRVLVKGDPNRISGPFAEGQIWLRETEEGWNWITRHMSENMHAYVELTALALKSLKARLPEDSRLLESLMPARAEPAARPGALVTG